MASPDFRFGCVPPSLCALIIVTLVRSVALRWTQSVVTVVPRVHEVGEGKKG